MYKQEEIEQWAQEKGIYTDPSMKKQLQGVAEEAIESMEAYTELYYSEKYAVQGEEDIYGFELAQELGDIYVFWINACKIAGVDPKDAVDSAYFKISKRKGKTVNGRFVKNG